MTEKRDPSSTKAIGTILETFAKKPNTSLEKKDVPALREKVSEEVDARVEHVTNNEPFYQSRVTMGSVLAIASAIVAIGQMYTDSTPQTWDEYSPHVGVIVGGLFALYGRWVAQKPIGR